MPDVLFWILLALIVIGFFTCIRFVWRLLVRLFRRKSREQRLLEELLRLHHEATRAHLAEVLEDVEAQGHARRMVERNGVEHVGDDLLAALKDGTGRTRMR